MPTVHFDGKELTALVRDLERATLAAPIEAAAIVTKGATNIKRDARQRVSGLPHLPAYPYSIGFDPPRATRMQVSTEIGPDKDKRQGALGNVIEYGSPSRPPVPHLGPAAEAEEPRFARAVDEFMAKALDL